MLCALICILELVFLYTPQKMSGAKPRLTAFLLEKHENVPEYGSEPSSRIRWDL
jgi:hypothetical protein